MKRCNDNIELAAFAGAGMRICKGIVPMLLLIFFGCASLPPQPVTIKHERTPSQSDAAVIKHQHNQKKAESRKEPADESIAALVDLLKKKNLISSEEGDRIVQKSEARATTETKKVREQVTSEVQEQVKSQVQEELPKEIKKVELAAAAPEWTRRIHLGGDIRLRYEGDRFDKNNADFVQPSDPSQLMNTKVNQDRFNYRVRLGAEAHVNENLDAVVVLATGKDTNPVSPNSNLAAYMNKSAVLFDLAYLKWKPWDFLNVYGGRIPNPWFSPTELVWDYDLNFDGIALNVRPPITESLIPFLTAGAFPLQQYDFSQRSKWLVAGQLGLEKKSPKGIAAKAGAAYYYFSNITGILANPLHTGEGLTDWTAPPFQQKGNTLFDIHNSDDKNGSKLALASEFKELNLTGTLDIGFWDPYHIVFVGDYVKNLGFKKADVARRTGVSNPPEEITGYQFGASVGYPVIEKFGQWKSYLYYESLGADAVVDAFTSSDFHLGGTNAKGWILGSDVGLWKNFWLVLKWMTAKEISGPPLAIDVFFLDFNARF